jgi:hypothetical protein
MGGTSKADRHRLQVGERGVEGVGAGIGLLPEDQVRQPFKLQDLFTLGLRFWSKRAVRGE